MKVTTKHDLIKALLEENAEYQDNYRKLIARVWYEEMSNKRMTAIEFLQGFRDGKYSHPESIMRVRRMVQEEFPHLQGKYRDDRLRKETMKVKKELGYYSNFV